MSLVTTPVTTILTEDDLFIQPVGARIALSCCPHCTVTRTHDGVLDGGREYSVSYFARVNFEEAGYIGEVINAADGITEFGEVEVGAWIGDADALRALPDHSTIAAVTGNFILTKVEGQWKSARTSCDWTGYAEFFGIIDGGYHLVYYPR